MPDRRPVDDEHEQWKRKRRRDDDDEDFDDAVWSRRRAEAQRHTGTRCGGARRQTDVQALIEEARRRSEAVEARRAHEAMEQRALHDPSYRLLALRLRGEADQALSRWSDAAARLRRTADG